MKHTYKRYSLGFILLIIICLFTAAFTTMAVEDYHQVVADAVAGFTGIPAAEVSAMQNQGSDWKELNRQIYKTYQRSHTSNLSQETANELRLLGLSLPEIIQAGKLAGLLRVAPKELCRYKPADMNWEDFAIYMQGYVICRRALQTSASTGGNKSELLAGYFGIDPDLTANLERRGLSMEETAGIVIMAALGGMDRERLQAELRNVISINKNDIAVSLRELEKVAGIGY